MPEWAFLMLFLGSLFIYKSLIGLQGFDMLDEGWVLSAYQQIFNDPSTCEYQFLYYNALVVGGIWNMLLGSLGIYGFRILSALCSVAIAGVVYLLLRKDINRWCIFLGIWIFNLGYVMVFHHNWLTALLVAIAALCLYKGLVSSNKWWVLLAGLVVGVNIFTRIPNVSMFALSLAFIPYYIYNRDVRATFGLVGMAFLGVVMGVECEVFLMNVLGHLSIFNESILSGLSASSASDSTHSMSNILIVYKDNYILVFQKLMYMLSIPMYVYFANKYIHNKRSRLIMYVVAIALYVILLWNETDLVYMIYALSYLVYILYILKHPQDQRRIYLITIAAIVLFFLPFGSDYGISNMGENCIWIAAPLTMGLLYEMLQKRMTLAYKLAKVFVCVFVVTMVGFSVYDTSMNAYFDHGSRLKKTARPNIELATTYMTPSKAQILDTLMTHLRPLVKKNDYLLCYQHIPMVNYLTETRPYLGTSLPWVYDASNMERHFIAAQNNITELPVIVRNKSAIKQWDIESKDWNNTSSRDQWNFNTKKIELIQQFINDHKYQVVWENELFQILVVEDQYKKDTDE